LEAVFGPIATVDAHTAGEPLRLVTRGVPPIPGDTILAKRRFVRDRLDGIRRTVILEPRGHADMYGCILTEPVTDDGDLGVLFLHNEGYSSMCGHGVIALVTIALETGCLDRIGKAADGDHVLRLDTPAGRVTATGWVDQGRVVTVSFENVPSYVSELDATVDVPGIGRVDYDLAFGGAFYAFCDATALGLRLDATAVGELIDVGRRIKSAVMADRSIEHPFEVDLGFLYGTIFVGPPGDAANHSRNVCIFADGEVDRSPTGTGVSARAAIHHARGEIGVGESLRIESILGTAFDVEVARTTRFGDYDAVVPRVSGRAFVTGRSEFVVDAEDPLRDGFLLR